MWLCEDDGDIGNFSNHVILAKINSKDFEFFVQDYPRFLARIEGLALGFSNSQKPTYTDEIDFSMIQKVCDFVESMSSNQREGLSENLKIYREMEFDRMQQIVSEEEIQSNFTERRKMACRFLAIMFSHDFMFDSGELAKIPVAYANYLLHLIEEDDSELIRFLNSMPHERLMRVVETLENSIALIILEQDRAQINNQIVLCIRVLDYLHQSNQENPRLNNKDFINEACSNSLNLPQIASQYYNFKNKPLGPGRPFLILEYPWLFTTEIKVDVLRVENSISQNSQIMNQITEGLQAGNLGNIFNLSNVHLAISVRRDHILQDSLARLAGQGKNLKKPLKVTIIGEAGVDAGGVRKEFFGLLVKELFNPQYAMFTIKNVYSGNEGKILLAESPEP